MPQDPNPLLLDAVLEDLRGHILFLIRTAKLPGLVGR